MSTLILYQSMFGNTARVAQAVARTMSENRSVQLQSIDGVKQLPKDLDVLIAGGPTYAHGTEAAMKVWLDRIPSSALYGVQVTAFDTRLNWPRFWSGAASKGILDRLVAKGGHCISPPESFLVEDQDGPLLAGEEERAVAWGRGLSSLVRELAR